MHLVQLLQHQDFNMFRKNSIVRHVKKNQHNIYANAYMMQYLLMLKAPTYHFCPVICKVHQLSFTVVGEAYFSSGTPRRIKSYIDSQKRDKLAHGKMVRTINNRANTLWLSQLKIQSTKKLSQNTKDTKKYIKCIN